MPPVGFEPTIAAGERPKTHALDRAATGTGESAVNEKINLHVNIHCDSAASYGNDLVASTHIAGLQ